MGNEINPKLSAEQVFSLIDKNGNGKIDKGDNLELAQMFGLKNGAKKIDPQKVKNYDSKISVFSSNVKQDNSITIMGDNNEVIVIHGENNEASISLQEARNIEFISLEGSFGDEAKFALMKKGLDPEVILKAGFESIEQKVGDDGETTLILKSKDGYNLQISNPQENATIARDANGNLILDGVEGELNIVPGQAKSHELILSNIYNDDVPILNINNKSGQPLTKTYPAGDNGKLSFDAAKALWLDQGFPEGEAVHGGFTQVSITENPSGSSKIHLTSSIHGFVLDVDGPATQIDDMELNYDPKKHRMVIQKLSPAQLYINEDNSSEHSVVFNNVANLHVENKTKKPVHITEAVMRDEKGNLKNDKSSFTYKTETNFDTFERQYRENKTTTISSSGIVGSHRERRGCTCGGGHSWSVTTSTILGAFDLELNWGTYTKTARKVQLAPGEFIIQPTVKDYDDSDKTVKLRETNKKNISAVKMYDYITTKEQIAKDFEQALKQGSSTTEVSTQTKIGRSGRDWNGLGIDNAVVDNSVVVNGNGNKVIAIFGDNNIAHIDAVGNKMSPAAHEALYENFHLNTKMFEKAGFTQVDFVRSSKGEISEIILTNNDGTKLTLPSDEAFLFSEQMQIKRDNDGTYHISGLVGKIEGSGMKIDCTDSNVDLTVVENDPANGYLEYKTYDNDTSSKDGIHINYTVPEGSQANVFSVNGSGKRERKIKDDKTKTYNTIDITYPVTNYRNERLQRNTPVRIY